MKKRRLVSFVLLILLLFTSCTYGTNQTESTNAESALQTAQFHFIDVGQGDCALIRSGDTNIMIDAGTRESGSIICEYLSNLGIDYLDCFIGTHPHEDHMGGGAAVLLGVDVGNVYLNGETTTSYFFERFVDVLIDKEITPYIPDLGIEYDIGPFKLEFLSPQKDFGNSNDNSLVLTVKYGDVTALYTGDAERSVEAELIKNGENINADILKVSHHGSRYASSVEFLNKVSPSVAVISSGSGNSYGHPHKEALERIEKCGAEILRCDREGTVVLSTDGKEVYNASGEAFEKREESEQRQVYIGNRKSKVFHCETCPNLPGNKNRVVFNKRENAVMAGYSVCGNCNP
ncbi:MAG: MBL fold metallo-hydrolase [Clostridia bacterium]|nr:MBL fold metallo-hydrolase [Clostridia bacterium]